MSQANRVFTATLRDGTDVLVYIWADGDGEVSFKELGRWGVPTDLIEDPS